MSFPIRTAILSYGMSGEVFHAPLIAAHPSFYLHGIVQRHSTSARSRYPEAKTYSSIDDAIKDSEVELVVVNTPNETHKEFAATALMSGKHVIVEKPFTVTPEEARELIQLATTRNLTLTVFQNRRWDGDFLTVRKIIEAKQLGTIVEFEAHYDRFRNYIEPNTWKEQHRPGTGILYNLGSHMLDQVLVLFGLPDWVDARTGIQRPGGAVDDFYDIRLEYPNHMAIIKSSYLVKATLPRYIIHGTEGSFVKRGLDPQEQALKEGANPNHAGWGKEAEEWWGTLDTTAGTRKIETEPGDYTAFYSNVFNVIRNADALAVKPEEGMDVIRLIKCCQESAKQRRALRLIDF